MIKLAVIGASYLQLPLIKKAKEMGIETHCFAWIDGAVCSSIADFFYPISILDKDLILEKCKDIGIDGITTIATDMAVPTISYVAEKMGLLSNSYKSALISTDKLEMRKAFSKAGCSIPKFIEVIDRDFNISDFSFPLIIKPTDRSGSRGVSKVNSNDELEDAIQYAKKESLSGKILIEEYIEGCEVSVEGVSWKGNHQILVITDKITTCSPHFVELAHHQPSSLCEDIQKVIRQETIKCLNALDIKYGASHSEFKITPDGKVFVIEVGARMGGDFIGSSLVELSTDYDFLKATIDIAIDNYKFNEKNIVIKRNAGVYFLSKETEKLLPYFEETSEFEVQKEILNNELKFLTNSNDRSGYFIYKSDVKIDLL